MHARDSRVHRARGRRVRQRDGVPRGNAVRPRASRLRVRGSIRGVREPRRQLDVHGADGAERRVSRRRVPADRVRQRARRSRRSLRRRQRDRRRRLRRGLRVRRSVRQRRDRSDPRRAVRRREPPFARRLRFAMPAGAARVAAVAADHAGAAQVRHVRVRSAPTSLGGVRRRVPRRRHARVGRRCVARRHAGAVAAAATVRVRGVRRGARRRRHVRRLRRRAVLRRHVDVGRPAVDRGVTGDRAEPAA